MDDDALLPLGLIVSGVLMLGMWLFATQHGVEVEVAGIPLPYWVPGVVCLGLGIWFAVRD